MRKGDGDGTDLQVDGEELVMKKRVVVGCVWPGAGQESGRREGKSGPVHKYSKLLPDMAGRKYGSRSDEGNGGEGVVAGNRHGAD